MRASDRAGDGTRSNRRDRVLTIATPDRFGRILASLDALRQRGCEVTIAPDAAAFAAVLEQCPPDVVRLYNAAGAAPLAAAVHARGIRCVLTPLDLLHPQPGTPFLDGRREHLVAALSAHVERLEAPSAAVAALALDLGFPADMIQSSTENGEAPIALRWTGDHATATSLATINRAVAERLALRPDVVVERVELDGSRLDPALERPPALEVRHRWPPDFAVPPVGRLALIQPWEFGAIPTAWEAPLRDDVDELWVPSEYVRRMYLDGGVPAERVRVVPNGVDLDVFRPDGPRRPLDVPDGTRFLFVGGTIARKGVDVLVRAYAEAFRGRRDVSLVVKDVSPNTHYRGRNAADELRAFAADPANPPLVYLDDDLDTEDLAALYRACDVLVHPYRGEGFAMPVLEAMACGLPVMVTAGGPTDEFAPETAGWRIASTRVQHPPTYLGELTTSTPVWMLEPEHEHLVELLRAADRDPQERRRRGQAAHAAAQRYGWEAVADAYAERIVALAARPPRNLVRSAEPLELPGARGLNVLAAPAWRGEDRLAELLAAWAGAFGPNDDAALFLLADPDRDGDAAAWEARVMDAAGRAGVDLENLADIALLEHGEPTQLPRVFAAVAAYVPLHDGCAGHRRLARAAGAEALEPHADALAHWARNARAARAA
jgi:glycosyltransferase involved in cell wall biosynthesis